MIFKNVERVCVADDAGPEARDATADAFKRIAKAPGLLAEQVLNQVMFQRQAVAERLEQPRPAIGQQVPILQPDHVGIGLGRPRHGGRFGPAFRLHVSGGRYTQTACPLAYEQPCSLPSCDGLMPGAPQRRKPFAIWPRDER